MNRKTFLKNCLFAGAGLTILPTLARASTKSNSKLQLALIGGGRVAHVDLKNALAAGWKNNNARVVAVCEVDAKRLKKVSDLASSFYKEKGESSVQIDEYSDFREVFIRDDIDGVIITTPDHWHAYMGVAAANAKKHIYLQKPLTHSIAEGQALVKAVRSNNVILQTGSQQRSSVHFRRVCNIIRNEWLGKLKSVEVELITDVGEAMGEPEMPPGYLDYDFWLGPAPEIPYIPSRVHSHKNVKIRPGWLQVERFCRGAITGWGSHMFDIAQWGLGLDATSGPTSIKATGDFPERGHFNVHTSFVGEALYKNGVVLRSRSLPKEKPNRPGVRFIAENGEAYCARGVMRCSNKELLRRRPVEGEISLYESNSHMGDFIESALTGKDPICPVEVGHRTNTVAVLHHISMKLYGRELQWDPIKEEIIDDPEASALLAVPTRDKWSV